MRAGPRKKSSRRSNFPPRHDGLHLFVVQSLVVRQFFGHLLDQRPVALDDGQGFLGRRKELLLAESEHGHGFAVLRGGHAVEHPVGTQPALARLGARSGQQHHGE